MACDLATQGKRLAWEKLTTEESPCRAAWGFRNNGSFPKHFWVFPDEVQPTPWYNFLNGGEVISYNSLFPDSGVFDFGGLAPIRLTRCVFNGSNELITPPPPAVPLTVFASLLVTGVNPADPLDIHTETAELISLTPDPRTTWVFGNWVNQVPGGLPTMVGSLAVSPLKQCHNCTPGP